MDKDKVNSLDRVQSDKDLSQKIQRVKRITDAVLSLPVLPTITAKMIQLVDNPNTSAQVLSNLVSKDQVLTAKVLKMANSSFYGFSREIGTVKQAVVILGLNSLRDLSLSLSVFNMFKNSHGNPYFNVSEFWKHSIGVGIGAQYIAKQFLITDPSIAFTGGLLHDLGKVVLNQYLPYEFLQVMKKVHMEGMELCEAELEVLGASHDQVGAWLANRWRLPYVLEEVMLNHHHPEKSEHHADLCFIIQLANHLVSSSQLGSNGRKTPAPLGEVSLGRLEQNFQITEDRLQSLKQEIKMEFELKASDFFSTLN